MNEDTPPVMDMDGLMEDEPRDQPVEPVPNKEKLAQNDLLFEDHFPKLDLTEADERALNSWFRDDLKKAVRLIRERWVDKWATYRAVFMLEYIEKFYPDMGLGAKFASGLLCEKVLEGIDRMKRAVFSPRPMFVVDDKTLNTQSMELVHRLEWFMHTIFEKEIEVETTLGNAGFFEFLLDGSLIVEADTMYERVPQRNLKTYTSLEVLERDEEKVMAPSDYNEAVLKLEAGEPARVMIEEDYMTKTGLQAIIVDKQDHLIPPHVYQERDVRFRGRRMYLTASDMLLLAEEGWYDMDRVKRVINHRSWLRSLYRDQESEGAREALAAQADVASLAYDWQRDRDGLEPDKALLPYQDMYAVYRNTVMWGYATRKDPRGRLPKWCVFDWEPESGIMLRAATFPHFEERKNWFHLKLGHAPKSYYGFGFGARLINDDFIESNVINLTLDAGAMATFNPFVCVDPEVSGGRVPFTEGIAPGEIGYVQNISDFKQFEIKQPSYSFADYILGLTRTRSENKTSITSLVQGRPETTDPRAPAQKAQLLLGEAQVGLDALIEDWNVGYNALADFVWLVKQENLVYEGETQYTDQIEFPGYDKELEKANVITLDELKMKVSFKSQASSQFLNQEVRQTTFLRQFQFFSPLLQQLQMLSPQMFIKYFLRWLRAAAQEMDLRNARYLIPTAEEVGDLDPEQIAGVWQQMRTQMASQQGLLGGGRRRQRRQSQGMPTPPPQ